jgi:hypothetical protein
MLARAQWQRPAAHGELALFSNETAGKQRGNHPVAVDAADAGNVSARDRLLVGNDGQDL